MHGLTSDKLNLIVTMLDERLYDLITLNETWFNWRVPNLLEHPYLVCHSLQYREPPRPQFHLPGGCALLARPQTHRAITSLALNDAVRWTYQGQRAAVVYLSPSVPVDEIPAFLHACGEVDLLMGDVNAVRGRNNTRTNTLQHQLEVNGLGWLEPQGQISRTDHVFSRPNGVLAYSTIPSATLGISTDHALALVVCVKKVAIGPRLKKERLPGSCTYDYRSLQSPDFRLRAAAKLKVSAMYAKSQQSITRALQYYEDISLAVIKNAARPSRRRGQIYKMNDLRRLAGDVDDLLLTAVQAIADRLFTPTRTPVPPTHVQAHTGDPLRCWKRITRAEEVAQRPKVVSDTPDGCPLSDVTERFSSLWTPSRREPRLRNMTFAYPQRHSKILSYITVESVRRAIIEYDPDTASGTDGISIILLKNLRRGAFAHHITTAFRIFARLSVSPPRWNKSLTILIPKDRGSTCPVARTRPISISPMFRRLFEKVTLPALQSHPMMQLRPAQTGFQKGMSTAINIVLLHTELQDKRLRTAFLDLTDCYDRLSFAYQRQIFKEKGVDPHTRNLLISMTQLDATTTISINGQFTQEITRQRGVPQGSIWSPFLYNLAADKLVEMVEQKNATFEITENYPKICRPIGLYADDASLQAVSDERLEMLVEVVEQWCTMSDMQISYGKCAALGTDSALSVSAGNTIEPVDRAQYLGVIFHVGEQGRGLDWASYFQQRLRGTQMVFRALCRLAKSWHPGRRLALVRSFIVPRTEYMAGVFFWCLLATATSPSTPNRKKICLLAAALKKHVKWGKVLKILDEEWTKWSAFILGGGGLPGLKWRAPAIHGLETPSCRFVELGILLRKHLEPLKGKIPGLNDAMTGLSMDKWGKLKRKEKEQLKTNMKKDKVIRLSTSYGPLGKRITSSARSPFGVDKVFQVSCARLCTSLIRWRQGTWGFRRFTVCVCGRPYYFGHWKKCEAVVPRVMENEIENMLASRERDENALNEKLERWEQQLAAAPGQAEERSRFTAHTRPQPAMRRRMRARTRSNRWLSQQEKDEAETGGETIQEIDRFTGEDDMALMREIHGEDDRKDKSDHEDDQFWTADEFE